MNLNKGCIEIVKIGSGINMDSKMNLNKGCIEMSLQEMKAIRLQR